MFLSNNKRFLVHKFSLSVCLTYWSFYKLTMTYRISSTIVHNDYVLQVISTAWKSLRVNNLIVCKTQYLTSVCSDAACVYICYYLFVNVISNKQIILVNIYFHSLQYRLHIYWYSLLGPVLWALGKFKISLCWKHNIQRRSTVSTKM